jgi:hypothetical protein
LEVEKVKKETEPHFFQVELSWLVVGSEKNEKCETEKIEMENEVENENYSVVKD